MGIFCSRNILSFCLVFMAAALASSLAAAEERCYAGDASSGTLEFMGAVEGTGFTGRFGEFSVEFCIPGDAPVDGRIETRVSLGSADTGNGDRDEALVGEEFFHVDQYPESVWTSRKIRAAGSGDGYIADGELRLKGITAGQGIRFTLSPDGADLIATGEFTLSGDAEVDRQRFEVGTGEFADPEFVRDRIEVRFEVRLNPVDSSD